MSDPNIYLVERIAKALDALCSDVVFVGGCAVGLLLTQERSDRLRITTDVDVVAATATLKAHHVMEDKLRAKGFRNDTSEGAPICRWIHTQSEGDMPVVLDLMPAHKEVLGFANRWYPMALLTARAFSLPSGLAIQLIDAPVFIATKLEAVKDRGSNAAGVPDFLGSHDLEDIMTVVDRRPELVAECMQSQSEIKTYLADEFTRLFSQRDFVPTLAGHLPADSASQQRLPLLIERLRALAGLSRSG